MADVFSKKKRSQVMAAIRSKGNKDTELKLASMLRENGIKGWRRHQPLLGKPDFVFGHERLAVFVDGCFWHGCPWHAQRPKQNSGYWRKKATRNKVRDRLVRRELAACGWTVLRIWEHALADEKRVLTRIRAALGHTESSG